MYVNGDVAVWKHLTAADYWWFALIFFNWFMGFTKRLLLCIVCVSPFLPPFFFSLLSLPCLQLAVVHWSRVWRFCRSAGGGGISLPRVLGFPWAICRVSQTPPNGKVMKYGYMFALYCHFDKYLGLTNMCLLITGTNKGGASLWHQGVFCITLHYLPLSTPAIYRHHTQAEMSTWSLICYMLLKW